MFCLFDSTDNLTYVTDPDQTDDNEEKAVFSQISGKTQEQESSEALITNILSNVRKLILN